MTQTKSIVSNLNAGELAATWVTAYFQFLEKFEDTGEVSDCRNTEAAFDAGFGSSLFAIGFDYDMVEQVHNIAYEMRANVRSGDCLCGHCKDD